MGEYHRRGNHRGSNRSDRRQVGRRAAYCAGALELDSVWVWSCYRRGIPPATPESGYAFAFGRRVKAFEGAPIGVVFARASRLGFVACDLSDDNNLVVKISQNRVSNQTYAIYVNGASCV